MLLRQYLLQQLTQLLPLQATDISLYLLKYPNGIIYRFQTRLSQEIISQIISNYCGEDMLIHCVGDYAVDVEVSDRLLTTWLTTTYQTILTEFPPFLASTGKNSISSEFFGLQYSHARCCAYLRQLYQQDIITDQGHLTTNGDLIELLVYLNERDWDLLKSLVYVTEKVNSPKLINNLSLAVLNFERYSGIWREHLELRGLKAILLILARYYLNIFLEQHLKVTAPVAL
jgi:hypothetical protein